MTEKQRRAPVIAKQCDKSGNWNNWKYYPKGDEIFLTRGRHAYQISLHGSGWIGQRLIIEPADVANVIGETNGRNIPKDIGSCIRGSLCVYLKVRDQTLILPDPLGGGIIFKYVSDKLKAYSSDIQALLDLAIEFGDRPRKNILYATELICLENGGINHSSYIEIEALDQFTYVEVSKEKEQEKTYGIQKEFFSPIRGGDRKNVFEEARAEVLSNVKAFLECGARTKIAHLTGGFDSRLVLSAMMAAGLEPEQAKFFCSGSVGSNDVDIASSICGHLGLQMISSQGLDTGNMCSPTSGLLMNSFPASAIAPNIIAAGGYGECLRSFFSLRSPLPKHFNPMVVLNRMYGSSSFNLDINEGIASPDFYNDFQGRFVKFIDGAINMGIRQDAILDYLYLAKRNRYYVGMISKYMSHLLPYVDPLYSLAGIRLALQQSLNERRANFIGLDLMNSFYPDLVSLPFSSERINNDYEQERGFIIRKQFNGNKPVVCQAEQPVHTSYNGSPTPAQILQAKALGIPVRYITDLALTQNSLLKLINLQRKDVSRHFNWKVVNRFARQELRSRVHIRRAHNLYMVLSWLYS